MYVDLRGYDEHYCDIDELKQKTYDGHLLARGNKSGILDTVAEHAHEEIESIESERREYPGHGVCRVVAYRDEKRNIHQHTTAPGQCFPFACRNVVRHVLHNPEPLVEVRSDGPDAS